MTLLEEYKGRLSIAEKYYAQENGGRSLSPMKKMVTAQCLKNTAKIMNESYLETSGATQMSNLGQWKKFCMDITTLVQPNLIVEDIFLVKPMESITGYLNYMEYSLGTLKGAGNTSPFVVNNPWTLGEMDSYRIGYTSREVEEHVTTTGASQDVTIGWTPVVTGTFDNSGTAQDFKLVNSSGTVSYANLKTGTTDKVTVATAGTYTIYYRYDNVKIPAAKLPTLVGEMKGITLEAKVRRIAIEYSLLAALQAKQDYNINFETMNADQAKVELQYETDNEAVVMVADAAEAAYNGGTNPRIGNIDWYDEELDTIGYSVKAEGFARAIARAKMDIYKRTKKLTANWMLVSPDIVPILTFVPGFKAASGAKAVGPYIAGEIDGLKVVVSPALLPDAGDDWIGKCYLGVNVGDGKTATGLYAPYLTLIPTQILGHADHSMEQGFATLYDMKILNDSLLSIITVKSGDGRAAMNIDGEITIGGTVKTQEQQ